MRVRSVATLVIAVVLLGPVLGQPLVGDSAGAATLGPDLALFDHTTGKWHLRYSNGFEDAFHYGQPGDAPLMGDWNCDGIDTVAMYRRSNGFVYYRNSNDFGDADGAVLFRPPR